MEGPTPAMESTRIVRVHYLEMSILDSQTVGWSRYTPHTPLLSTRHPGPNTMFTFQKQQKPGQGTARLLERPFDTLIRRSVNISHLLLG